MLDSVNHQSSVAVYAQIENQVQLAIASGELEPGDKLPSVHEVANKLNANAGTAAKAYRGLEVTGLIETRRGLGCHVQRGVRGRCRRDCLRRIVGRLYEVASEARAVGIPLKTIREIASKSYAHENGIYGEVPKAILKIGRK